MLRTYAILLSVSLLALSPMNAQYIRPSHPAFAASLGGRLPAVDEGDTRSPVLAGVLSAIIPGTGIGSFYAGSPSHGLRHLFITLGAAVAMGAGCSLQDSGCTEGDAVLTAGSVVILANAVWSVFAAVDDANRFNEKAAAPARAR